MLSLLGQKIQYQSYLVVGTGVFLLMGSIGQAALPGDLTIYRKGTAGQVTLVMMLDNSGSMSLGSGTGRNAASLYEDYRLNGSSGNCTLKDEDTSYVPSYKRTYCQVSAAAVKSLPTSPQDYATFVKKSCIAVGDPATAYNCYARIDRLKDGMVAALDDPTISSAVVMGVGTFASSDAGKILLKADALGDVMLAGRGTKGQRYLLKQQIVGLGTPNATPTAPAYAEAAAYLMGTTTVGSVNITKDIYRLQQTNNQYNAVAGGNSYSVCGAWNSSSGDSATCQTSGWGSATSRPSTYPTSTGSYQATTGSGSSRKYYLVYTNPVSTAISSSYSGFSASVIESKDPANTARYLSPLPTKHESCDGQGIYFLTDGQPNLQNSSDGSADTEGLMQAALGSKGSSFSCSASNVSPAATIFSGNSSAYFNPNGNAWDCISSFASTLYGNTTTRGDGSTIGDGATNPVGIPIQTALVGFGTVFSGLSNADAVNACNWGARKGGGAGSDQCAGGYGNGGFYNVYGPADVTNSIFRFIKDLTNTDITPLVTGPASIPVDGLDPSGFQPYGYMRVLTPNPASTSQLLWDGNLKKYNVIDGALKDANKNFVLNDDGTFVMGLGAVDPVTKVAPIIPVTFDLWNTTTTKDKDGKTVPVFDGGVTRAGGAFSKTPMPTSGNTATTASPRTIRPLFTNYSGLAGEGEIVPSISSTCATTAPYNCGTSLLAAPKSASSGSLTNETYIQDQFNTAPLSNLSMAKRLTLLNYLGYNLSLSAASATVPVLTAPSSPFLASGGIIHSLPIQLSYSGELDADGNLKSTRTESVLYGSMDGALHLVAAGNSNGGTAADAEGGKEQMVFVPKEILDQSIASQALIYGSTGTSPTQAAVAPQTAVLTQVPAQGVDGAWVADASYTILRATDPKKSSLITASKMNVYGGLRMGGSSFYALNLLNTNDPKILFRIGADQTGKGFDRMGQSWSKPVLANVRYNGAITRVMIVGGGYDVCYESPTFALSASTEGTACNGKLKAAGNAVYMVDATTGQLIWEASDTATCSTKPSTAQCSKNDNIVHSIVSRITTLDRNADGLIDHLYFGDLGGQVFRADFDNPSQRKLDTGTVDTSRFGVRVVRLANLANTTKPADSPRFYEAPTVTVHDEGADRIILVGVASGDRSSPLDVLPLADGGKAVVKPVNNAYGIIDRDFVNDQLISVPPVSPSKVTTVLATSGLASVDIVASQLQPNPQLLSGKISSKFFGVAGTRKEGWYRSLSSDSTGAELGAKTKGGMKALEEPIAITGNFLVPVYDPEGIATPQASPCSAKVVGETIRERFCLPYGACLNADGAIDSDREAKTGAVINTLATHPTLLGNGIRGITMADGGPKKIKLLGNIKGSGEWTTTRKLIPTRWYEKQPNPAKVK